MSYAPITAETTFIAETLVTDTVVWEIVARTERTLTIRHTGYGEKVRSENRDGNPYPCVWTEAVSQPDAATKIVRLRKDGSYRTGQGANPLRPATMIDGKPVTYTDYRM